MHILIWQQINSYILRLLRAYSFPSPINNDTSILTQMEKGVGERVLTLYKGKNRDFPLSLLLFFFFLDKRFS